MKKFVCALFFVIMTCLTMTLVSCSGDGSFSYRLDDDGNAVISGYSDMKGYEKIEIPSTIDGHRVVGIYELGLAGAKVSDVVFPEGLTKIDSAIFYNAEVTGNVYIPASVTDIAHDAFALIPSDGMSGWYFYNPRMEVSGYFVDEKNIENFRQWISSLEERKSPSESKKISM